MRADRPRRQHTVPPPVALAIGTHVGPYQVRNVLGSGAFGIVYRVMDANGDDELALKEYLPPRLAVRDGATQVALRSPADAETYALGLRFFVNEGKLLARIRHPALVHVHDAWEENGTAYMAMDLYTGRNLVDTMRMRWKTPKESTLRALLEALLGALESLHGAGMQHRDVSPYTIVLELDGRPVLMDLGAPRRVTSARGESGAIGPRDGYAPIELYDPAMASQRGPWTDFYALGATLYYLMAGKALPPAPQRSDDHGAGSRLIRPGPRYSLDFIAVVDWMLALAPADRPQSVDQVRAALAGQGLPPRHAPTRRERIAVRLQRWRPWLWGAALLITGAALAGTAQWLMSLEQLPWGLSRWLR
jgi:serine/threonine protein kinase